MSNAFKFTFNGGIGIGVELVTEQERQMARISVRDTGVGISEEAQPKLFQLFSMISTDLALNPNGCGIGLTISKKYVE